MARVERADRVIVDQTNPNGYTASPDDCLEETVAIDVTIRESFCTSNRMYLPVFGPFGCLSERWYHTRTIRQSLLG